MGEGVLEPGETDATGEGVLELGEIDAIGEGVLEPGETDTLGEELGLLFEGARDPPLVNAYTPATTATATMTIKIAASNFLLERLEVSGEVGILAVVFSIDL